MDDIIKNEEAADLQEDLTCGCHDGCVRNIHRYADISVPVEVKPVIRIGDVETECIGTPDVICCDCGCPSESCSLIVNQNVRIKIPICYKASATPGISTIQCSPREACD